MNDPWLESAGHRDLLDAVQVRLPPETVRARLAGRSGGARGVARGLVGFWLAMAAVFVPLVWATSGRRAGLCVLAATLVLASWSGPLARRHLGAIRRGLLALPWGEGVSFLSPSHGLVLLTPRVLALGDRPARKPVGMTAVTYDPAEHALRIVAEQAVSVRSRANVVERVSLPPAVGAQNAEAMAFLLHYLWTGEVRAASEAVRGLLLGRRASLGPGPR